MLVASRLWTAIGFCINEVERVELGTFAQLVGHAIRVVISSAGAPASHTTAIFVATPLLMLPLLVLM